MDSTKNDIRPADMQDLEAYIVCLDLPQSILLLTTNYYWYTVYMLLLGHLIEEAYFEVQTARKQKAHYAKMKVLLITC